MFEVYNIIDQLAATDSSKTKEQILFINKDDAVLKECFRLAYSKNINFYVRQFSDYKPGNHFMKLGDALADALENLASRKITGHAAIEHLNKLYSSQRSQQDAEVFKRVILGDLECGTGTALANKVWPKLIPEQPQNLCQPFNAEKIKKHIDFKSGAIVQLKADGARAFCDIDEYSNIKFLSRAGNEYEGLTRLHKTITKLGLKDVVLDGELVYKPISNGLFEDDTMVVSDRSTGNGIVSKALKGTITDSEQNCVIYQIWNITPRDVYYGKENARTPYELSFAQIEGIFTGVDRCLDVIPSTIVYNYDEARSIFADYVEIGLEGIILKNRKGLWKDGRSNDQYKFKVEEPVDLRVVGYYPHKKDPNKLGGLNLQTDCGTIKVDVGSGFKDKDTVKVNGKKVAIPLNERHEYDRGYLWSIRDQLIDCIVQFKSNGIVKDKKTGQLSLFLPIFEMIRRDKNQTNELQYIFDLFNYKP